MTFKCETMHSVAEMEEKGAHLLPDLVHKHRTATRKESEDALRTRNIQVKFKLNIIEEKDESAAEYSTELLGSASSPLLSNLSSTEVDSNLNINNVVHKANTVSKKEELVYFRRTLKMLGFELKEFGISDKENDTQRGHIQSPRSAPTFSTRLRERTVSLENLRAALQDIVTGSPEGEMSREMLARAAYEEWYFQKLEKARKITKSHREKEKQLEEKKEKVNLEQKQKAEENFKKWVALKNKELLKKKEQKLSASSAHKFFASKQKDEKEAFAAWKREKDKILKQNKQTEQKKETKNDKNSKSREKEKESEMIWKKKTDEALRAKTLEENRKKQEKEKMKSEEQEERKRNAEASFLAWKKAKDEQLKRKEEESRLFEEKKQQEKTERELERCYEAEQAFEEWLDEIEERQRKPSQPRSSAREPWSPGGSTNWLHSL